MTVAPVHRVAILGLHAAGKTTYITAFFIACDSANEEMAITQYADGDREYLNSLADALAACKQVERTSQTQPGELRLKVRLARDASDLELVVPDLSGELLRESMTDRVLDPQIVQLLDGAQACLLFVRVDKVVPAQRLVDFASAMRAAGEALAGDAAPEQVDWSVEVAATQVRLVDIVQELLRLPTRPQRLGLVLSAWDARADVNQSPRSWADEHLPLLTQLLSHGDIEWTVFGLSAQGGDYDDSGAVARLETLELVDRPFVHAADQTKVGIGEPLKWALRSPE